MAYVSRGVAGLYRRPEHDSELVTQETLGHRVEVLSIRGDFAHCILRDGYKGWMPAAALAHPRRYEATHVVRNRFAPVRLRGGNVLLLPMGSVVKAMSEGTTRHEIELPDGTIGSAGKGLVERIDRWLAEPPAILALLREVIGTPYLWGGKSSFGFDCSGLVQFIYGLAGMDLPRDSGAQARKGRLVKDLSRLRPFDLLFFGPPEGIDHVAIHMGDLGIAHASGWVRIDSLDRSSSSYRQDLLERFRFGRRVCNVHG